MVQKISQLILSFAAIILFLVLQTGNVYGLGITKNSTKILIVDSQQSESGDYCAKLVTNYYGKQSLTRVDISSLAAIAPQNWDAVIIVRPDPANNSQKVNNALKKIIHNPKSGLLIWGLPVDQNGQETLLKFLGDRSPATVGNHFEYGFENCKWIWTPDGPRDNDTVYFRQKFNVDGETAKASAMLTADNSAIIWVNGQYLGENISWTQPCDYDITQLLKPGENTVCVKAQNGDGAAGLIVSLNAYDKNGKKIGNADTNNTWKCSRIKFENWNKTQFNDSEWVSAKQIGTIDIKPWSNRVNYTFKTNEQVIYLADMAQATQIASLSLGSMVILDSLMPTQGAKILLKSKCGNIAVAKENGKSQKIILISGYPELGCIDDNSHDVLGSEQFDNFMTDSLIWLMDNNVGIKLGKIDCPSKVNIDENLADIYIKSWDERGRLIAGKRHHLKICKPFNLSFSLNTSRTIFKNTESLEMTISATTTLSNAAAGSFVLEIFSHGSEQSLLSKKYKITNPLHFDVKSALKLSQLKPGKYDLKILVMDKAGKISETAVKEISITGPLTIDDGFPIAVQYSKIPCTFPTPTSKLFANHKDKKLTNIDKKLMNIREHGFTCLYIDSYIEPDKSCKLMDCAQSLGMMISYSIDDPIEQFNRDLPPKVCVYSPHYPKVVSDKARHYLNQINSIPRLLNVFMYQDEPFHWGSKSFGYNPEIQKEFLYRYGYKLPDDLKTIYDDPKKWLDVINFRSDYFRDGWRQAYKCVKNMFPNLNMVVTHDSHNTFGAGAPPYTEIAMDDVYHWSGDWADTFVFDIYPYMGIDFRYGENLTIPKPRLSQVHFALGQVRNLTDAYGKKMGFWFGTYNNTWFNLTPERKKQYWSEREMCYTAIANGADFLVSGYGIPEDAKHWKTLGQGLNIIQKVGSGILKTRKLKSKVAFLFPRTQYIQLQEEYWNVAQSFELFLRGFGELDVIHEEQIHDKTLNGYKVLIMCDIKLLPEKIVQNIVDFVKNGGILIADCIPTLNQYKQPMEILKKPFGVTQATSYRIVSSEGYKSFYPEQAELENLQIKKTKKNYSIVSGQMKGYDYRIKVVSPRSVKMSDGRVLLHMKDFIPGLIKRKYGLGSIYLICFCLQDTYFETWKENDFFSRMQLRRMINYMFEDAGVVSHVYSSNPDIEASVRANKSQGYLFLIGHEATEDNTTITLADLPFDLQRIVDVQNNKEVTFECKGTKYIFETTIGEGKTKLFELFSKSPEGI